MVNSASLLCKPNDSGAPRPPVAFDPERADFTPYGLTCVHWRPSPMRRPDHHNEIELNFLESGTVTYLLGGRKTVIEAGRLHVFWAAIPHQIIDFGNEPSYYVATIPLQWFLQWQLPDSFVQPLLQGRLIDEPAGCQRESDTRLFANWENDLLHASRFERPVLLEMQARLMRMALNLSSHARGDDAGRRGGKATEAGLNKVEQMACFIAIHYTEALSVRNVGESVNLHPNYAMSLFRKSFGTTLVDYLTQHRVCHAQRLLATTDQPVVEVAHNSGFHSLSRFNEAFRRTCGCSPRDYRKSHLLKEIAAFS